GGVSVVEQRDGQPESAPRRVEGHTRRRDHALARERAAHRGGRHRWLRGVVAESAVLHLPRDRPLPGYGLLRLQVEPRGARHVRRAGGPARGPVDRRFPRLVLAGSGRVQGAANPRRDPRSRLHSARPRPASARRLCHARLQPGLEHRGRGARGGGQREPREQVRRGRPTHRASGRRREL
ncbi:MAG: hypothetical protein AVDCRST_MAG17-952, partial [uncultured Solirubrobacterales bacterium]